MMTMIIVKTRSCTCHCGNTWMERTPNKSQHTNLTLEKKILPPLLPARANYPAYAKQALSILNNAPKLGALNTTQSSSIGPAQRYTVSRVCSTQ